MARVLVVEADPDARRLIERILAGAGHQACVTDNAAGAAEMVREQKPDIVILDINLPDMAASRIRQELEADPTVAGTPVFILDAENFAAAIPSLLPDDRAVSAEPRTSQDLRLPTVLVLVLVLVLALVLTLR